MRGQPVTGDRGKLDLWLGLESTPVLDKVQWAVDRQWLPWKGQGMCPGARTGSTESKTGDSTCCEQWVNGAGQ